jgi:hypothetical protein
VDHRHLFPNEIDLLVDGEVGFGVAPLRAHLRECAECSAELQRAQDLAEQLDSLAHLAPSPLFTSRVMSQVRVFEPWHVAAMDSARRMVPASRQMRLLAVASVSTFGTIFTIAFLWVIANFDAALFVSQVGLERARIATLGALSQGAASVLGEPAAAFLGASGIAGISVALALALGTALLTLLALRALAAARVRQ